MTRCVCVIRQSQGSDASISLEEQREEVPELANALGDPDPFVIDLGNHTGFSILSKDVDEERIDAHPAMQQLEEDLEAGKFDYVVAYNHKRIARDDYFEQLRRHAKLGGAEFAFVEDSDVDHEGLTGKLTRAVETDAKLREIERSKKAWQRWAERSEWQGPAPIGLKWAPDHESLQRSDRYDDVLEALDLLDLDAEERPTYREISERTGISTGAISKVKDRGREFYERF